MTELHIRGISPEALQMIDAKAKEKQLSRNLFVVGLLENYTALQLFSEYESRYDRLLKKTLAVVELNTKVLNEVLEITKGADEA